LQGGFIAIIAINAYFLKWLLFKYRVPRFARNDGLNIAFEGQDFSLRSKLKSSRY